MILLLVTLAMASIAKIDKEMKIELNKMETQVAQEVELQRIEKRSLEAEILQIKKEEELARLEEQNALKKIEENKATIQQKKIIKKVQKPVLIASQSPSRSGARDFTATAYDLSVASTGKDQSHPAYGITASGVSLKGKSLGDKYIAVDPKVIKLGSKVHIEFFDDYSHLTGYYTAVDTGGAIKGNKVDIFFGSENVAKQVKNFGIRKIKITD